jgi:hypothetical protein
VEHGLLSINNFRFMFSTVCIYAQEMTF